ncbi:MAG: hypothetical protein ACTSX4_09385 [Candidatus Helarchaeota archaeon]
MIMSVMSTIEKLVARRSIKASKKHDTPVVFMFHVYPYSNLFRIFEKKNELIVKNPDAAALVLKSLYDFYKDQDNL